MDVYMELRDLILRGDPHARGWSPSAELPRVWGALVEVGLAEGPATLVGLKDGTTSLYLGNGGATIGAGAADAIADGTRRLLLAVEGALAHFTPTWEFPLPETGHVRMVALTYEGAMTAEAGLGELEGDRHPLAAAFRISGEVVAEVERLEASAPSVVDDGPLDGLGETRSRR